MVRRKVVPKLPSGIPLDAFRCAAEVSDKAELFSRRCRKVRLFGIAFCEIHRDTAVLVYR